MVAHPRSSWPRAMNRCGLLLQPSMATGKRHARWNSIYLRRGYAVWMPEDRRVAEWGRNQKPVQVHRVAFDAGTGSQTKSVPVRVAITCFCKFWRRLFISFSACESCRCGRAGRLDRCSVIHQSVCPDLIQYVDRAFARQVWNETDNHFRGNAGCVIHGRICLFFRYILVYGASYIFECGYTVLDVLLVLFITASNY